MEPAIETYNYQFRQFQQKYPQTQIKKSPQILINKSSIQDLQKNHNQSQYQFKFYTKQSCINGVFDMRFNSIKKSPINSGPFDQLKFAASFQLKKFKIHSWNKKQSQYNVLETVPETKFNSNPNQIQAYWLGHASVLLSIDSDTRIIIDPMFDKRLVSFVGQTRHLQPPCNVDDLPPIDCVLISHDHYDHCNTNSLQSIYSQNRNKGIIFLVGKNSSDILPKKCQKNHHFRQLSWTQSYQLNKNKKKIKITFVPACHWSKRSINDQNTRLWGGFVIQALGKKIYFAGDTGYCELFPQLYQKFKGFDLSFLPIGAYEPNEELKAQHVNPKEAVFIHNQVKSKHSVGIHWGTFPMSHQKPHQVLEDLEKARKFIKQGKFVTIKIGQSVCIRKQQNNYKRPQQIKKQIVQHKQNIQQNQQFFDLHNQ